MLFITLPLKEKSIYCPLIQMDLWKYDPTGDPAGSKERGYVSKSDIKENFRWIINSVMI